MDLDGLVYDLNRRGWDLGFRAQDVGFRAQFSGFRVILTRLVEFGDRIRRFDLAFVSEGLGFTVWVEGSGRMMEGDGNRVYGEGLWV